MSTKAEYEKKLQDQLDKWNDDLDELKVKADKAEIEFKAKYQEQIIELRKRQEDLKVKLDEFRDSSEDAWEDVKAGLDIAWEGLSEAFKSAAKRYK